MALHFVFDGKLIFIPQRGQSRGVARRLAEVKQSGASFFHRSESGRIRGWQHGRLENVQSDGGVARAGMGGATVRMRVVDDDLGSRVGGSRTRDFCVSCLPVDGHLKPPTLVLRAYLFDVWQRVCMSNA